MQSLMMDWPLTLTHFLDRARRLWGSSTLTTRTTEGVFRYTNVEFTARVERLAGALTRLGVKPGDRVATFAWNTFRHYEAYFAVPCMGAVLHPVNIRLFPEQIVFVMNHAEDQVVLVDASAYPLFEKIRPQLTTVREVIVMDDVGQGVPPGTLDYEKLLGDAMASFAWPDLDERTAAAMCYTSGTTGQPKGCVYSHRALVLHTLTISTNGIIDLTSRDTMLSIVPMFHVFAWGLPFAAAMCGMNVVFPGRFMQPKDLAKLLETERVTYIGGVPTIVGGLYQALKQDRYDIAPLRLITVGGSALPRVLLEGFRRDFGVTVRQGWGMTETGPVGTISFLKPRLESLPEEEQIRYGLKAGVPVPLVDLRLVDEAGRVQPHDGIATGELQIRGPYIVSSYYNEPRNEESFADGWFRTGDVATIDKEGYLQLVDRTKDLVKSGGEWISSVDLENAIMGHPAVAEAAVIAVNHPKWVERPLACVVLREPGSLAAHDVVNFLRGKVADWWLPDDVVFLESIPKTSVGKFDKKVLRARFKNHLVS
jgi:fatty-acyl-CoA synthase